MLQGERAASLASPAHKQEISAALASMVRMVSWMCDVKVKDRVLSKELRQRPGIDDMVLAL